MKSFVFGSVAILALAAAGTAVAADMPVKAPVAKAASAMAPVHKWAGLYVGAHGGYGASKFDGLFDSSETNPDFIAFGSNLDAKGGFGGIHAGYLFQNGSWVYGGEVAGSFMNWKDQTFDIDPGPPNADNIEVRIRNLITAVAKLGYAHNSVLYYGVIGAARADATWTVCDECGSGAANSGSVKFNKWGLALGGGVTVAVSGPWSVGIEGMHIKFNDRKDTSLLTIDSDVGDFGKLNDIWTVKGKVNYRFDWGMR